MIKLAKNEKYNPIIKEKFAKLKLSPISFQSGAIYMTNDLNILMPGRDTIVDKPRMVVVIGNNDQLNNPILPIVTCMPVTTVMNQSEQCLPVCAGNGGLDKDSVIKVGMMQPILKVDLSHYIGTLDIETQEEIKATVLMNLGIFSD